MNTAQIHVLIPAAGRGTRYGGAVMKQYLPVCGKAVLSHTISLFQFHPMISGITVILAEGDQWFRSSLGNLANTVETVVGGGTRAQSVRNGLQHVTDNHPDCNWVLVHDAAHQDGRTLTDEASAMEFVGIKPKLVMGSVANIKITHPTDLAIAEALLGRNEISS